MKKSLRVGVLALAIAGLVAQASAADTSIDWGVKLGLSSGRVSLEGPLPMDWSGRYSLARAAFGAYGSFSFGKRFAIQPEVLYFTAGGGGSYPNLTTGEIIRLRFMFDCLEIPVLAKFRLMQGVRAVPVVFAGPSVGFLLKAKARYYLDNTLESEQDVTAAYKTLNLGLLFGLGVEWKLGRINLVFDARFDWGLTDIAQPHPGNLITRTRTFFFFVGAGI